MFGAIYSFFSGRDPKWPALRKAHLLREPACRVCGKTEDVEVHHFLPVSWFPEKELEPRNLGTFCREHHYTFGHLCDWESYNPFARTDSEQWARKIAEKPVKAAGHWGFCWEPFAAVAFLGGCAAYAYVLTRLLFGWATEL